MKQSICPSPPYIIFVTSVKYYVSQSSWFFLWKVRQPKRRPCRSRKTGRLKHTKPGFWKLLRVSQKKIRKSNLLKKTGQRIGKSIGKKDPVIDFGFVILTIPRVNLDYLSCFDREKHGA